MRKMQIEDMSSRKLKRYYFRVHRKLWRYDKWIHDHSTYYPGFDSYNRSRNFYRNALECAHGELKHRNIYVINPY